MRSRLYELTAPTTANETTLSFPTSSVSVTVYTPLSVSLSPYSASTPYGSPAVMDCGVTASSASVIPTSATDR